MEPTKELKTLAKVDVEVAIGKALAAPAAGLGPAGCARIYVCVSGVDKKTLNAVAAACKSYNLIFQRKAHYGLRNAIYIGYSINGKEYNRGEAFAAALTAAGIPAYMTAEGD